MDTKMLKVAILFLTFGVAFGRIDPFGDIFNSIMEKQEDDCKPSALPPNPDSQCCGIDVTSSNRIVGGDPTKPNQYPWLALLEYKMKGNNPFFAPRCGGSLISSRFVITAAHCATGEILEDSVLYNVILGEFDKKHEGPDCVGEGDTQQCTDGAIRIRARKVLAHPKYDEVTSNYDLALILLKTEAPYTESIRPICMPTINLAAQRYSRSRGSVLYAAGWGISKQWKIDKEYEGWSSAFKRHVKLPFVHTEACQQIWQNVNARHICAGGEAGKDVCMGDSGGPLMQEQGGQFQVLGVVSYGPGAPCGKAKVPGVYTNVYMYKRWLTSNMKKMLH